MNCPKCKAPFDIPAAANDAAPQPLVQPLVAQPAVARPAATPRPLPLPDLELELEPLSNPTLPDAGFQIEGPTLAPLPLNRLRSPASPAAAPVSPRRAPVPRQKNSNARRTLGAIAALVAVALLIGGLIVGALMLTRDHDTVEADLKFMPDNCDGVVSMNVRALMASDAAKKLKGVLPDFQQLSGGPNEPRGAKPEDVGRVTFGWQLSQKHFAGVIHYYLPLQDPALASTNPANQTVGHYSMHVEGQVARAQVDGHSEMFGDTEAVRKILARDAPANLADDLATAMKEADFSKPMAMAMATRDLTKASPEFANPLVAGMVQQVRGLALHADVDADIMLRAVLLCNDDAAAEQVHKAVEGMKASLKTAAGGTPGAAQAAMAIDSLEMTISGSTVRGSLKLDVATVLLPAIMAARAQAGIANGAQAGVDPDVSDSSAAPEADGTDLAAARQNFVTHLKVRGRAPQRHKNETPPPGVRQVEYVSGKLKLKGWLSPAPADGKRHPAVVFLHGGWAFGGDDWRDAAPFADAGFVLFMPKLRAENGNPGVYESFYGEVDDAIAAGQYVAKLPNVDSANVFVAGHSVGAVLTTLVAMMPSPYKAAAAFDGSVDMKLWAAFSPAQQVPYDRTNREEVRLRNPLAFVGSLRCPLTLYAAQARAMNEPLAAKAKQLGKECELISIPGNHQAMVAPAVKRAIEEFQNRAKR